MIEQDSDLGVVCRVAHECLDEGTSARNEVLRRLPLDCKKGVDELIKDINTSIGVPPAMATGSSTLSFIYQKVVLYQVKSNHHQPPSRFQSFKSYASGEPNPCDNLHAKRIVCELLKSWALGCKTQDDENVDVREVNAYFAMVTSLLYHHDRWSKSTSWNTDAFMETLVLVHRRLDELTKVASNAKQKYLRVLERISEGSHEIVDHALRVMLLAMADNHAEMSQFREKNGHISLKALSERFSRNSSVFWCTDFGQVIHSALVRADPARFKPLVNCGGDSEGCGEKPQWSVWETQLAGTVRSWEFGSLDQARDFFEKCSRACVLVGPSGKLDSKSPTTSEMLTGLLKETSATKEVNRRVDLHLVLQRTAQGLPAPKLGARADAPTIEDFLDGEEQGGNRASASGEPLDAAHWINAVDGVKSAWMRGSLEHTGISEPFRGGKRLKWVEGVFEKKAKASDFPTLILDVCLKFVDLLACHIEVMGAVRGMIKEGGSKEALAAIYALRQRQTIDGRFFGSVQRFISSASLVHGLFEHEFFRSLEGGQKIKAQDPAMQRLYYESFRACTQLRDSIMTQWHTLSLTVSDEDLGEEARRMDIKEKAAFSQLLEMPVQALCLTNGPGGAASGGPGSGGRLLALPTAPWQDGSNAGSDQD